MITRTRTFLERDACCMYCGNALWHTRFWMKVDKKNGPMWKRSRCWMWLGSHDRYGYGRFGHPSGSTPAYRVSYLLTGQEIPKGFDIDHLCRNKSCVNPRHLEAVPKAVNLLRGQSPPARNARKAICERGHALSGANVYFQRDTNGKWYRQCRTCRFNRMRKWFKRHPGYQAAWKRRQTQ